jgi:hypothetical protein
MLILGSLNNVKLTYQMLLVSLRSLSNVITINIVVERIGGACDAASGK